MVRSFVVTTTFTIREVSYRKEPLNDQTTRGANGFSSLDLNRATFSTDMDNGCGHHSGLLASGSNNIDVKCRICLNFMVKPVTFPCKHEICLNCYEETMDKSNMNCPFCRKRLSVWARTAVKLKTLINESKWQEICVLFPGQVKRAMELRDENDDGSTFTDEVGEIKRVLSHPGEIKKEFEDFIRKEMLLRQQEAQRQEEQSIQFIQEHFREETQQSLQEQEDLAFAISLQRQLDKEMAKKERAVDKKTRTKRTITRNVHYDDFYYDD